MNKAKANGNWNEQKGRLKMKYNILTDLDLMYEGGKQDEMFRRLQNKLGKTREELQTIITGLTEDHTSI